MSHYDKSKTIGLYGDWQIERVDLWLVDGKLPRNEWGNFEYFNEEIPEGTVYLDKHKDLKKVLKKEEIEYVECMQGFDRNKSRATPIIKGMIIHSRDLKRV